MLAQKSLKSCLCGLRNVLLRGHVLSASPVRLQHSRAQQPGTSACSSRPETSSAKSLMDIGTRRIFTEDHDLFRQNVRRFFQEEVVPYHNEWEKAGQVSREVWEKAGEQGLLGVLIPEEHGGVGGDVLSSAMCGRSKCTPTARVRVFPCTQTS
ncbi:hypothetical protein Q5P01_005775 [Channa striata]|uniref:Acyl-CoA dehydrogenase/oxidase N-terminal domain-containing protein n=1 Tax=Channa striata TaxID=64152 RepID=A0AA88NPX5_CHASR|nr:hypothetical protein Q5P01_005775 [Channa striata]